MPLNFAPRGNDWGCREVEGLDKAVAKLNCHNPLGTPAPGECHSNLAADKVNIDT